MGLWQKVEIWIAPIKQSTKRMDDPCSGVVRGQGSAVRGAPPQAPERLRLKNVAGGSAPRNPLGLWPKPLSGGGSGGGASAGFLGSAPKYILEAARGFGAEPQPPRPLLATALFTDLIAFVGQLTTLFGLLWKKQCQKRVGRM